MEHLNTTTAPALSERNARLLDNTRGTTEDERWLLDHVCRWGSDGYPILRLKRGWLINSDFRGVPHFPTVFKTKRAAVNQLEAFLDVLREALAAESLRRECGLEAI